MDISLIYILILHIIILLILIYLLIYCSFTTDYPPSWWSDKLKQVVSHSPQIMESSSN